MYKRIATRGQPLMVREFEEGFWGRSPRPLAELIFESHYVERESINDSYIIDPDGTVRIPVKGLLTTTPLCCSYNEDSTSYEEIYAQFSQAIQDEMVKRISFVIDSPGGEVEGLFDLVDFIYQNRGVKPIQAVATNAFSAAYAIASAAEKVYVTRTGGVGSIGVIATHVDISESEKQKGVKMTTIYAGDKKNDLSPHYPLSENAAADLQKEVNRLYDMFVETVARNRAMSQEKLRDTQAATYYAGEAVKIGLADRIVKYPFSVVRKGDNGEDTEDSVEDGDGEDDQGGHGRIIRGGIMSEDLEKYKAEVLEITKLCKLANAEERISSFIQEGKTAEEVKTVLLDAQSQKDNKEIMNAVYTKEAAVENPVLKAARERAGRA